MKTYVKILDLHCCQIALGMLEVQAKVKEFSKLSKAAFRLESKKDPVEVVIGPEGEMYIVDGHHRSLAAHLAGHKKIFVKVKRDYSKKRISCSAFWKDLKRRNCVQLHDQFGEGPHEPLYLPIDVRGLGDDPYRSLAWMAREHGAFKDTAERFADFKWANFYREHKLLHGRAKQDFKKAWKKAVPLSGTERARRLPGFVGPARSTH